MNNDILNQIHDSTFAPYTTYVETANLPKWETDAFETSSQMQDNIIHNPTLRIDISIAIELLVHARTYNPTNVIISPKPWDINPSQIKKQVAPYTHSLYPIKLHDAQGFQMIQSPKSHTYFEGIIALNYLNYAICFNNLAITILYNTDESTFNYSIQFNDDTNIKIIKGVSTSPIDSTPFIDPRQHLISFSTMK